MSRAAPNLLALLPLLHIYKEKPFIVLMVVANFVIWLN